ncbi:MAG: alpha amylase family protein [Syntrophothermus sp.]
MKNIFLLFILLFSTSFAQPQKKLLWFDATANWERLSYIDSIKYYLDKTKEIGFTDVVLDVRPITGEVLYSSSIAPQIRIWNGIKRDDFDFVGEFIKIAHSRGLKVHASLNIFVAGHNFHNRGLVYMKKYKDWQSINYTDSGMVPITEMKHKYSAMLNPALQDVQDYQINLLKEFIIKYPSLDGIILDRVRYDGIESDFSMESKRLFEKYLGKKIKNFPKDIYEWNKDSLGNKIRLDGIYFNKWIEWRASVIYNFIKLAKNEIKKLNDSISFGDYTGAWYPTYYEVGANWASKDYDPSKEYSWATPNYKKYGYAELLDLFTTGNYFYEVTKEEVDKINLDNLKRTEAAMTQGKEYWYSVEGSAELVRKLIPKNVPFYAGLYVDQYKGDVEQFKKAVKMCLQKSNGLMIFDIVHIINNNWWDVLKEAAN